MEKFVFISHSSVNAEIAKKLCEYLEERKIKCFIGIMTALLEKLSP